MLALVPPVKPVDTVAADKADISLQCLCTYISSGAGAYYLVIMFGYFFSSFVIRDSLSNGTINVVYSFVS